MSPRPSVDVPLIIVGAGPAGLLAAWSAARLLPPGGVWLLDRMPAPGAKLAATGGGRGNLTHLATEDQFAAAFGRHGRFTIPAFRALPPDRLRALLAEISVPTFADETGRVYPKSQSASQVREALVRACTAAGVRFILPHLVRQLVPPINPGDPWQVDDWTCRSVVLATGGQSAAHLGSDGSGLALARNLGYDIVPPVPALCSLHTAATWPARHSGLSLPDVELTLPGPRPLRHTERGEMLFTHRGISGPAVLNISGRVARLLHQGQPATLRLSLLPEPPDVPRLRQTSGTRPLRAWLSGLLPRALAETLLDLSGIPPDLTFSRLSAPQEQQLKTHLLEMPLAIQGTGGFAESMATSGGVSLRQVRPETLEGRHPPRLHFAGEILDLDGPTGGWNLQWAFASGFLAGQAAASLSAD